MSISANLSTVSFTGNGTTTYFPFSGKFFADSDLRVSVTTSGVEVVKTLTTHYTVTGAGSNSGGAVTFLTAPANGTTVVILRNTAYTQVVALEDGERFSASVVEDALDRATLLSQQLKEITDRSIKFPPNEGSFVSQLPKTSGRVSTLLGFDASGVLTCYEVDIGDLTLVAPASVNTASIVDGAVTEAKLAATLDLTSKAISYPAESIEGEHLAAILDLTNKTISFDEASISGRVLENASIGSSKLTPSFRPQKIAVGFSAPSPNLIVTEAGEAGINGTWTYDSLYNSRPQYLFPTIASYTHYLHWDNTKWCIYSVSGPTLLYSSTQDVVYPDEVTEWTSVSGANPPPSPLSLGTAEVEVNGTVKATDFEGDISACTGRLDSTLTFGEFPDHTSRGGICTGTVMAYINLDGHVMLVGGPTGVYQPSGFVSTLRRAIFKQSLTNPVTGVTDNLNGFTDTVVKLLHCGNSFLALTAAGFVYAMGDNSVGQLGQGDTTSRPWFTAVKIGTSALCTDIFCPNSVYGAAVTTGVTMSASFYVIVETTAVVYAWGYNNVGQLGNGGAVNQTLPVAIGASTWVAANRAPTKIVATNANSYVLTTGGYVYASGKDTTGQIGTVGAAADVTTHVLMDGTGTTIIATDMFVAGGFDGATYKGSFWVTIANGTLYGTGYNADANLGNSNTASTVVLTAAGTAVTVSSFYPLGRDSAYAVAVKTNGSLVAWGDNTLGQTGTATVAGTDVSAITVVSGITLSSTVSIVDVISVGSTSTYTATTLVLTSDGKLYAAGYGVTGLLGNGDFVSSTSFVRVPLPATVVAIHACGHSNLASFSAADSLGRIWTWGNGSDYQLGTGDTVSAYTPTLLR